ncbi:MAG: hypothetical protein JWM21_1887 [Acidobacteria bacterium]|nr:hypothetical protein [Acidobacteriota bacterium]
MPIDITRLQAENQKSLEALDNSIARLNDLMDDGLPLSEAIAVNAQLSRAQGDKIHLQLVRAHLGAAGTIVGEMDPAVVARLDILAARLDQAIQNDFLVSAGFDLIKVTLSAAEELSDLTSAHTTQG